MNDFRELIEDWNKQDMLTNLANYHSIVGIIFGFLKHMGWSPGVSHNVLVNIQQLLSRDIARISEQLAAILGESESYKSFLATRGTLAQQLLDLIQDLLDLEPSLGHRNLLFKALIRLSRASGLHPRCFAVSGLQKVGQQVAGGAFGDIWKGLVRGQSVSVKIMRVFQEDDVKAVLKEFSREALIWRQLSHPNLLPFFGVYYLDKRLCLVSPWMKNGNILEFLKKVPSETDRLSLMLDIATGLEYLHEKHVVHGDLKAINILVTPSRRACIADFGLSSVVNAMTLRFTHSTASTRGGTTRWQAPELLMGKSLNHFPSDVYAFACVCYEIFPGKAPFSDVHMDTAVMFKVLQGERPPQPNWPRTTQYDGVWSLLQDCWKEKPDERPTATQIVEQLIGPVIQLQRSQFSADWDEKYSSKFRRSLQDHPLLPSVADIERIIFSNDADEGKCTNKGCTECFPIHHQASDVVGVQEHGRSVPQPKRSLDGDAADGDSQQGAAKKTKPATSA
ncbi:kinase-like domain-containing protein [Mycena sp. CBHHK59/15]|nr:kinase-like domain-containing protein [Mycena sp. CBHHK59/15]